MSSRDTGGMATAALTVGARTKPVTAAVGILAVATATCMGVAIIVLDLVKLPGPSITPTAGIGAVRFVLRLAAMQTPTITAGIAIKQTIMPQIPMETKTVAAISAAALSVRLRCSALSVRLRCSTRITSN